MLLREFDFNLPEGLIAQAPLQNRTDARLLFVGPPNRQLENCLISDLSRLLMPGDLLILNNTKVIPARLFGRKASGGAVEVLVERVFSDEKILIKLKANRPLKKSDRIILDPIGELIVIRREGAFYVVYCTSDYDIGEILERSGHVPLPPYIRRADTMNDVERYQTLFATEPGAVAAPTAGLHITDDFLKSCKEKLVEIGCLTLHIGSGTYSPIKTQEINEHIMHSERMVLTTELCEQVNRVKSNGGRIFAVGTTVLRALETVARTKGRIKPFVGETQLFVRPGFRFNVVDCLLTNFHMPKSSLFVLLSAFAGLKKIREVYQHAVSEGYRFYSYGDAMLISKDHRNKY